MSDILSELDIHLSSLNSISSSETREFTEIKSRLKKAKEKIVRWESIKAMIWDFGPEMVTDYLEAVDEVRRLEDHLRSISREGSERHEKIIDEAENVLQIAMARLEQESVHILLQSGQSSEPNKPFCCCEVNPADEGSVVSADDDSFHGSSRRTSCSCSECEQQQYAPTCLINPEAILILKSIVNVMFAAKYDHEFCEAFVRTRKEALEDCLINLRMERLSIEELLKMDWPSLECNVKRWTRAIKTFVCVHLAGEKSLCDQIFNNHGCTTSICFVNSTKSSMAYLMNFGEAIALGPRKPEKLYYLLNIYVVLVGLCPQMDALFSNDDGSLIRTEFVELVLRFGDSARRAFLTFGDAVLSDQSRETVSGGIHSLTNYVMNYFKILPKYRDTINLLLQNDVVPVTNHTPEEGFEGSVVAPDTSCLMAFHLRLITGKLEANLEKKSRLYKDSSLRHIFLLNNIHYMVQKVRDSELQHVFGDDWIKTRITNYQSHAKYYVRETWGSVVAWLRDDSVKSAVKETKETLKERIRGFNLAIEEAFRRQRGWCIRDTQLKDELQASVSQQVVLAYLGFIKRCRDRDLERHIKYEADELQKLLSDLF
ncbi:hypothetical protein Nepgr_023761 [Nepenthes gracilis]|uniref:Exocyst subunit Exo70 family protein n=1 Tax=Nepenthes gracilis TaxID=150966 RepID=A0AAD3T1I9_NEPGR|nr:hypothetical protein Nepgr_023761 [Nepenthes gracilis]